jgi:hypothetical protein
MPSLLSATPLEEQPISKQIKMILLQDGRLMDIVIERLKVNDVYLTCRPNPNGSIVVKLHDRVTGKQPKFQVDNTGLEWFLVTPQEGKGSKDIHLFSVPAPEVGHYDYRERMLMIITNCELALAA